MTEQWQDNNLFSETADLNSLLLYFACIVENIDLQDIILWMTEYQMKTQGHQCIYVLFHLKM